MQVTPRYMSIPDWCAMTGMGRSSTYEGLGDGRLRAIKLGVRTLIDVEHGLAYLASLPVAQINTSRNRRGSSATIATCCIEAFTLGPAQPAGDE